MRRWVSLLLFCVIGVGCGKGVSESPQEKIEKEARQGRPLLKIGDKTIYEGHFLLLRDLIPGFNQDFATPRGRREILDKMIEQEIFLQKSREAGLIDSNHKLQEEIWLQLRAMQGGPYLFRELDKRAREQYEKDKDQYFSSIEVGDIAYLFKNAPGKNLKEQKEAAIRKALETRKKLTPENFAETASRETEDLVGKGQGGKIDPVSFIDQRVFTSGWGPLIAQAFRLKKGEISEPIVTQEGVHLITPVGEKKSQSYEEVGPFLREQMLPKVKKEILDELKPQMKIEFLDPALKPPDSPQSAPASQPAPEKVE
ncbi:MAG: peptidylprolyl isomerase [bacterium]